MSTQERPVEQSTEGTATTSAEPLPIQVKVQMMATEHWSLLASRNLAWSESFARAGMFLSTLSFSVVALALVGQATGFGVEFRLFALIVLPVVLFLGIATSLRMDASNHHDALCVVGMNRIRAGYIELAPDLKRFFVMGTTDDVEGIVRTMAVVPGRSSLVNLWSASPVLIAVMNAVLAGAIAGLAAVQLGAGTALGFGVGAVAAVGWLTGWLWVVSRMLRTLVATHEPAFPGPRPTD